VEVIKIDEMFTDICVRGKGVARQMLNFLENEVRGSEYNHIDLVSVSMETDRIWERMGFKSINYTEHYRKTV
jgi:predicted GNAT family acetyltransferase